MKTDSPKIKHRLERPKSTDKKQIEQVSEKIKENQTRSKQKSRPENKPTRNREIREKPINTRSTSEKSDIKNNRKVKGTEG